MSFLPRRDRQARRPEPRSNEEDTGAPVVGAASQSAPNRKLEEGRARWQRDARKERRDLAAGMGELEAFRRKPPIARQVRTHHRGMDSAFSPSGGIEMSMDEMPGDVEAPPTRLRSDPTPAETEEYALALVAALEVVTRTGGRAAVNSLFDRGFDRVYAWSYLRVGRKPELAQALTRRILLSAALAFAQHESDSRVY